MNRPVEGAARLDEALLGGPRRYTRVDIAQLSGVPLEEGRRIWRAMGFPEVADDEVVFTDADLGALRLVLKLEREGLIDPRSLVPMARAMGHNLARLADWQVAQLRTAVGGEIDSDNVVEITKRAVPELEQLLAFVWRRQLAAAAGRTLAAPADESAAGQLAVGFADLVSFTELTRRIDEGGLSELLEHFEGVAVDTVVGCGGRVVKTVGDEVLFVHDVPRGAADTALSLVERIDADDLLPPVRTGLAYGTVLSRLGDVYGPVVNLASRLTSLAKPGTVLVDLDLAGLLGDDGAYHLRRLRRRKVSGYEHLVPTLLRRGVGAGDR